MADVLQRPAAVLDAAAEPVPERTPGRGGSIGLWAALGIVGVLIAAQTWVRWIASDDFQPAPILGPDQYPTWREVALRVTEVLSFVEMSVLITAAFILPWRRHGRLGIEAKITAGCLVGCVTDGVLNMHQYLFAWNAHSVNRGSWHAFVPFATVDDGKRYAEALIWGIPMYTYFCIGVAYAGCALIRRLRRRSPGISDARALLAVFGCAIVFDFVVENTIIRLSQAYSFAKTPASVTLFAGEQHQFPIYESVAVGLLGVVFTALRLSAQDSADGLSFAERGVQRFRPGLRGPLRWFAVIGFAMTCLFVIYHLPFNWFGVTGNSTADLPSYMLPGR